jgi:hypothetical protein
MAIRTNFDKNAIRAGINTKEDLGNTADSFSTRNTVAEQGANKALDNPSRGKTRYAGDRAFRELVLSDPEEGSAQMKWMDEFTKGGSEIGFDWKEKYDMAMGMAPPSDNIDKGKSDTMSSEPTSADQEGTA